MNDPYVDFDVVISRDDAGYSVRVPGRRGPDGEPLAATFSLPFSATELAGFMVAVGPPRVASRRLVPVSERVGDVRELGQRLGDALLSGAIGATFRSEVDAETRAGRDVRLRLDLEGAPDLQPVPWEYLYSAELGRFLTLSNRTPIIRQVKAFGVPPPVVVNPPLRVLVMISSPSDVPQLAVDRERQLLEATTKDLVDVGLLELVVLDDATLPALQRALLDPFHVFHFVGHGGFDRELDEGVLVLERDDGTAHRVTGARLGTLLHDARDMQLAVLNACEGARSSGRDAFSGVGQALVRQGLPAVVAMQTEISDRAALVFSHELYSFLTRGLGIDAAICEVRKAMATSDEASEWGTAVLLRSTGGSDEPFTFVPSGAARPGEQHRRDSLYAAAKAALATGATATAAPILEQLAAEKPGDVEVTQLLEQVRPEVTSSAPGTPTSAAASTGPATTTGPDTPAGPPTTPPPPPTDPPSFAPASAAPRRRSRVLLAAAAGALLLVTAVGAVVWRNQGDTPTPTPSAGATGFPQASGSPTTSAGIATVTLPTTGEPTGALVLPYAVDGDFHSAAGSNQSGSDGDTVDVLRLPGGNRVVTVTSNGLVKMVLEDQGGTTIEDLGHFRSRVEANRGGRFAYVDGDDGRLSVRDTAGREVARLPGVGTGAEVVGFAGPAVFFTDNGTTFRWDTTTSKAAEWRQSEMVAFNDSTRTAVGGSGGKCFAVVGVDTPTQATKNLDCQGLELKGVTGDGRYAIAWTTPTGPEETRVLLVDITTGKPAFAVRVPSGSSVVQAGYRTHPVPRALVLSTVTPDGRNRLVGCPTDGTCEILTEPKPTAGDPEAPPPYVIARD
ncbi:CHAT domain-containing protein [Humibacillus xanthopallidus]|uniref:CHAT domain-containing protein n=1 Tax=Humibacillus xanthopallidus TaxID=412689 RepID=A0A543PUL4_9MICO|nr:CHAT domain-containing protein [Humibacillus xanthopallidus]TQN47761.1 CHAT domain-containing protein [Humibacillus xanthopallidus]